MLTKTKITTQFFDDRELWSRIPVQLYTDHFMDYDHTILSSIIEFCHIYWA